MGTFDISVLELRVMGFEVKSTNGDVHLGGDGLRSGNHNWWQKNSKTSQGFDLKQDPMACRDLKEAAEKLKILNYQVLLKQN